MTEGSFLDECRPKKTTGNVCTSVMNKLGGKPDTATIFVRTDCATREPLPRKKQNPVYNKVSLLDASINDRSTNQAVAQY
jgi:hypothetical protein